MKKLVFDSGLQEFKLGSGGVLRFNPGDPNVYARFMEAADKLQETEKQLIARAEEGADVLEILCDADKKMKDILGWVFTGNDFDKLLCGINLLAVAANGERVVTNLLTALEPVLVAGAKACAREKVREAKA